MRARVIWAVSFLMLAKLANVAVPLALKENWRALKGHKQAAYQAAISGLNWFDQGYPQSLLEQEEQPHSLVLLALKN